MKWHIKCKLIMESATVQFGYCHHLSKPIENLLQHRQLWNNINRFFFFLQALPASRSLHIRRQRTRLKRDTSQAIWSGRTLKKPQQQETITSLLLLMTIILPTIYHFCSWTLIRGCTNALLQIRARIFRCHQGFLLNYLCASNSDCVYIMLFSNVLHTLKKRRPYILMTKTFASHSLHYNLREV